MRGWDSAPLMQLYSRRVLRLAIPLVSLPFLATITATQGRGAGDGIYKTIDGGKTFTRLGLNETQTIARIVIDPKSPETVYAASPGHLFGPSPDRGIYKTSDGGKTWNKIKFIDDDTGFTDIVLDPSNSNIVYAASYQRRRSGCCFNGGGPGSGLWKSSDAGKN